MLQKEVTGAFGVSPVVGFFRIAFCWRKRWIGGEDADIVAVKCIFDCWELYMYILDMDVWCIYLHIVVFTKLLFLWEAGGCEVILQHYQLYT